MKSNRKIAIVLFILANILWGGAFFTPFLDLSLKVKGILISFLAITGEIMLWLSVVLGGRELLNSMKNKINPFSWIKRYNKSQLNNS